MMTLEKQLLDEEQYLQRMRAAMVSPDFLAKAPPHVVEERKIKMQEVKTKINQLQFEIQKLRSDHV